MTLRFCIVAAALAFAGQAASAQQQPVANAYGPPVTRAQAEALIKAASDEARRVGARVAIAVVEPNGALVAFVRFDDASYAAIDLSQGKARTAAMNRRPSQDYFEMMSKGANGLATLGVTASPGGIPLLRDQKVIGAIGVSGAAGPVDAAIAQVAVTALN